MTRLDSTGAGSSGEIGSGDFISDAGGMALLLGGEECAAAADGGDTAVVGAWLDGGESGAGDGGATSRSPLGSASEGGDGELPTAGTVNPTLISNSVLVTSACAVVAVVMVLT